MKIIYQECLLQDIKQEIIKNNENKPVPFEVFAEYHILNANHFNILFNDQYIGYCSIFNGNTLVQFYLNEKNRRHSQKVFTDLMDKLSVSMGWIRTCDEFFLSLSLGINTDIKQQAYCFRYINKIDVQSEIIIKYRVATLDDLDIIWKKSDNFFDADLSKQIKRNGIYIGFEKTKPVAFGLFERGRILEHSVSIGMFTIPDYREKSIAKMTLNHLLNESQKYNLTPTAGCWVNHTSSKRVLEGVGMITDSMYLKISYQ